jgi:hypothetical protein
VENTLTSCRYDGYDIDEKQVCLLRKTRRSTRRSVRNLMRPSLTERDRCLLDALSRRVRILSFDQVADAFWSGSPNRRELCRRRILQLADAGYVQPEVVFARSILDLLSPVAVWSPDSEEPQFGALSYQLARRWTEPVRSIRTVYATSCGAGAVGGVAGRAPRRSETTHDLHLAQVYLKLLREQPERAASWESEALTLQRDGGVRGEKRPDAILRLRPHVAIEFGGAYSAKKLRAFHEHCREHGLAYEIW